MISYPYFQLSVLNFNNDSNLNHKLYCRIINIKGLKQEQISFPFDEAIEISLPESSKNSILSTPTWYITTEDELENTSYEFELFSPVDNQFASLFFTIKAKDVIKWSQEPNSENKIFQNDEYYLSGEAKKEKNGIVFNIIAKVLEPTLENVLEFLY